jgi:hypothetical protein
MPKRATVKMGEREYVITEKVMAQSAQWRDKLRKSSVMLIFESLDNVISQVVSVGSLLTSGKKISDIDFEPVIRSLRIVPIFVQGLSNSIEEVIALVFDYCPEMAKDRKWIEENAYDEDAIVAFVEILKFCFPIMALWDTVRGSRVQQTSTKSPSVNGTSGLPASGPVRKKA